MVKKSIKQRTREKFSRNKFRLKLLLLHKFFKDFRERNPHLQDEAEAEALSAFLDTPAGDQLAKEWKIFEITKRAISRGNLLNVKEGRVRISVNLSFPDDLIIAECLGCC